MSEFKAACGSHSTSDEPRMIYTEIGAHTLVFQRQPIARDRYCQTCKQPTISGWTAWILGEEDRPFWGRSYQEALGELCYWRGEKLGFHIDCKPPAS